MPPFLFKKTSRGKQYWYIGENKREKGKVVRAWETYLGTAERIVELLQQEEVQIDYIEPTKFGAEAAALLILQRLKVRDFVNGLGLKKRNQGLDLGRYIELMVINRIVDPKSKSKIAGWYKSSFLKHHLQINQKMLSSQRFWDHMSYFDQDSIELLEHYVTSHMIEEFDLHLDTLLYDPTNFSTYINKYRPHELAKMGKSKSKRKDLLQINLALLATRNDGIPLLHHTYEGNINDITEFKTILPKIVAKYDNLQTQPLADLSLVFDKGNNSKKAISELSTSNYHFVGSLRPSRHKDLLAKPVELYNETCRYKQNGEELDAYRSKRHIYGEEFTVVMTYCKHSANAAKAALNEQIKSTVDKLQELADKVGQPYYRDEKKLRKKIAGIINKKQVKGLFDVELSVFKPGDMELVWEINQQKVEQILSDRPNRKDGLTKQLDQTIVKLQDLKEKIGKPYYKSRNRIEKKIDNIVNKKRIKGLITAELFHHDEREMKLDWKKDQPAIDQKMQAMGKRLLFTNQHNWSTQEIVDVYGSLWRIEHDFHELKSPDFIRVTPMFHWTVDKLKVHLFVCVLALIVQRLIHREVKNILPEISVAELFDELKEIYEVSFVVGNTKGKRFQHSKLNKTQRKLMKILDLDQFLQS